MLKWLSALSIVWKAKVLYDWFASYLNNVCIFGRHHKSEHHLNMLSFPFPTNKNRRASSLNYHVFCDIDQEPNISSKMNGEEVCSKEDENKLKNDENNEDKFTPLKVQDASAEPPGLEGLITSQDMKEKSRELFDDKVTYEYFELKKC